MKVITGKRASGKTYQAIKFSSENWVYILVKTRREASEVYNMANLVGFNIPYPVTINQVKSDMVEGSILRRDGVVVDNAMAVLQELLPGNINMATVEMESDEE